MSRVDGNPSSGWAIGGEEGRDHVAVFELRQPVSILNGINLSFTLEQRYEGKLHNIGRFRLSAPVVIDEGLSAAWIRIGGKP